MLGGGGACRVYLLRVQLSPSEENAVGVSLGTLGEGTGQSGWKAREGARRGAMGAGAVGGIAVTLKKIWESVWMAAN